MKHLKSFKLFEEVDTDSVTNNKMRDTSKKMVDAAKKYEQQLVKSNIKFISKSTNSSEESRKLRAEAIKKIQEGDKNSYGIMQWSGDICQSFQIISPLSGKEIIAAPKYAHKMKINCTVAENFIALEVYNSPNDSTSLYMEKDGEVLYQWKEAENFQGGKLVNKVTSL